MRFPTDGDLVAYVERETAQRSNPVTRRDIARAFGVKGTDRTRLRETLKRLEDSGKLQLQGKRMRRPGQLPPVTVLLVNRMDEEGDLICGLTDEEADVQIILPSRDAAKSRPPVGVGDRFLGKLHQEKERIRASIIKPLGKPQGRMLGVFRASRSGGVVEPVSRKSRNSFDIAKPEMLSAQDGDLVWAEPKPQRGYGPMKGRITEVIGSVEEERNLSLIALAEHDIRLEFPGKVLAEADRLDLQTSNDHVDLTGLPLVTIDPATARDHDDAVHAEKLDDGGFRLTVAIADVSYFVRPGSTLDKEAEKRGNSVYLPDRVVPMLPERLSNDLCSLKEGQVRLALCCEIEIDGKGAKRSHRFFRAQIKNHHNLAYEKAQAIEDGDLQGPGEVKVLFEAYRALVTARARRKPLDLDMPERRIVMGEDGRVAGVERKERKDAHKLVEECMVLANVCAAETLREHDRTAIYRVHDVPDPERLDALRTYLTGLGYSLPKSDEITASNLNGVLQKAREREEMDIIAMSVLRSQRQAIYDTENIGHFGLSLKRYAHFTSPIRRYADLTVHRGLVRALGLGDGGERPEDEDRLETIAEEISKTERTAVAAERDSEARMLASYLESQEGAVFSAKVSGVTRVGLFVALDETGADGFIPARTLGWERFEHDEARNAMVSEHDGRAYTLGMPVKVRLLEVTPVQGGLRFEMLTKPSTPAPKRQERQNEAPPSRHEKAKRKANRVKNKKRNKLDPSPASESSSDSPGFKTSASPKTATTKLPARTEGHSNSRSSGSERAPRPNSSAPAGFKRRPRKPR